MDSENGTSPACYSDSSAAAGHPILELSHAQRWRQIISENGPRPDPRSGAASVVYENSLYILGGYGGNGRLDDLWEYRFLEEQWHRLEARGQVPAGRENNGAVIYRGCMYIFGGYSGVFWLNDFHRLDLCTLEWSPVVVREGVAPSTRFGYVSAVWKDCFIVFGGYDGSTWLNDMHEFNFPKGKWARVEVTGNPPCNRSCPSWATYKHSLYVFGGYDGVQRMNDFYEFDFKQKMWRAVVSTGPGPSTRYFHSSVVYGDYMYLFGGYSGTERLQDLYQFSFEKNCWSCLDVEKPPSGRSSLVAQVYKNSLYIFGGYNGILVLNDFHEFRFELISVPQSSFISDLRSMINSTLLSDVTFVIEGREIKANKAIMAARSNHFRALFYGGMKEQHEGRVEIPDIAYNVFEAILEYLYTDTVRGMNVDMAVSLMIAAEQFMLDRLKAMCQDSIRKNISTENVVPILRASYYHRASALKDICLDFISAKSEEVKKTRCFGELVNEPGLLMEIVMRLK